MAWADGVLSVGSLVELTGLPDIMHPSDILGMADGTQPEAIRPNGKRGKVIAYLTQGDKYTVETFDAVILTVDAANLLEYVPELPEHGGFHLAWPANSEETTATFAASATQMLMERGYCVLQMGMSDAARQSAFQEAGRLKYRRMRKEFESAYLGRQYRCKTTFMDSLADNMEKVSSCLDYCDFQLSNFTSLMVPLAPSALGFFPYSRTNSMVRMPFQNANEEVQLKVEEVSAEDIEDGLVDSHIEFMKRRHICMLYVVESNGAELTLIPKDADQDNVILELEKGRMIVFLQKKLSYIYSPFDGTDLVLQSWILEEPQQLQFVSLAGDQASKDHALGLRVGPNTPDGMQTNVFGIGLGLPAGSFGTMDAYWASLAVCTDGVMWMPFTRFDMDEYYVPNDEYVWGKVYTGHAGIVCEDIYALDNQLFGIGEEEAYIMSPSQKALLEKGYEALFRSGYKMDELRGKKIGLFVGHSGDDWSNNLMFTTGKDDVHKLGHQARIWSCLTGRLAYTLGLRGPQTLIDTACSSSLIAYGVGHGMLRYGEPGQVGCGIDNGLSEALAMGVNLIPGPGNTISLCGPHMLSVMGRCFTFDHSADGYCRGEGSGAFLFRRETASQEAVACVIGVCLNQDGRSASMTAPNGPAQQECIRGSMREAGLSANQVTCAECHGTGTALGDPIEVGALRGVMQDRVVPLLQTSAKAHIGHLEAGAGIGGIVKCMLMCNACAGTPNVHLTRLNPHLDVEGFPTIFPTEISDYGFNSGYSGVSSFGFGGANARADVFSTAKRGARTTGNLDWNKVDYVTVTCPVDGGPMHYTDGRCVPGATSKAYKHEPYRADAIRGEFDAYDVNSSLYTGRYHLAPRNADVLVDEAPKDPIYIVGSWDCFREAYLMDTEDGNRWNFVVMLGDTRCERFQLRINNSTFEALYPFLKDGSMHTRCAGPDDGGEGHYWLLDGRDSEVPTGTAYCITLVWSTPPTVSWEPIREGVPSWAKHCRHSYAVLGSWTGGVFEALRDVSTADQDNTWEAALRIGNSGSEWFRFVRDGDPEQLIYPSRNSCSEDVPVRGPDNMCNEKCWHISGKVGEAVTLRLQMIDAHVILTVLSNSMGNRVMHSVEGPQRHGYYVAASFTGWLFEPMELDPASLSTFRYRNSLGLSGEEFFYVAADADPGLSFFPEAEAAYPGESIVAGPDAAADGRVFHVFGLRPGAEFEIRFDRNALDRRKIVDVRWITDRVDSDSMQQAMFSYFAAGLSLVGGSQSRPRVAVI